MTPTRISTPVVAAPHVGDPPPGFHGWRIVAAIAITHTIGYGCLYYTFAVLLHPIAADLHTSATAVTGALTTALLASAAAARPGGGGRGPPRGPGGQAPRGLARARRRG